MAMISAHGVSKLVGGRAVVDDVTCDVGSGEWLGLAGGPSHADIVLLRILATLVRPTAGAIRVDGIDIVRQPFEARRRLLYVGAGSSRPTPDSSGLRVDEYLWLLARVRGVDVRAHAVVEAIRDVELKPETAVEELRVEERVDLILVAVRILQPKVVLIEDPSGSAVSRLAKRFGEGDPAFCAVVVASDDTAMLEKYCQRVMSLDTRRSRTDARERVGESEGRNPSDNECAG
jgi:ABC-type multidrug transport system ATPase subunit